ncbi:DUF411 domain-containing protein [Neisseria sp. Dent CA1/247]|uniref:DUF411 domain-containing protein n=1 Tax=Neisseria sp. Dent CA1/247 TaxID=2912675 RepID=UPI001FCFB2E6|nr:DUF411 domain-containing protein [Neisseria sp. Dent CA1/247]UOO76898.1 DUF411 domain-containing protein [Neisseria sp. Dent CA1/247]
MKQKLFFTQKTTWVLGTLAVATSAAVVFALLSEQSGTSQTENAAMAGKHSEPYQIEVWKDPNCGCCAEWAKRMEGSGFKVVVNNTGNREVREKFGMPRQYGSCHTAKVGGYIIEGHTPAADIRRLLKEKPDALGLATPGMPLGSPGMDGEIYQNRKHPYDVLLVAQNGSSKVYQSYR